MDALYAPFVLRLPAGAFVLDAGCGPGRDALAFDKLGFQVSAFDASAEMARIAAERLGRQVPQMRFQDLNEEEAYDGIWACTSLLHVPAAELPGVLRRLARALTPGGVLYASFKYGRGERRRGQRTFTDLDEEGLALLLKEAPQLEPELVWVTGDIREGRGDERWLNAILRRRSL